MVGKGVEGGVAVVGVGVEGELCVCTEVLEGAGEQFGLGDHFPADLFGAVVATFVFADADADDGVGGQTGGSRGRGARATRRRGRRAGCV